MEKAGVKPAAEKPEATAKAEPQRVAPANPVPAKPAAAAVPSASRGASGPWRIQLGAFGQRSSADTLFKKLSGKLAGKQPFYVTAGAVTRLQVGPYATRAAATAACASLSGQACFPVSAK
jgi:cell division septation protein DedD